jgi:hypothetical protein
MPKRLRIMKSYCRGILKQHIKVNSPAGSLSAYPISAL